MAKLSNLSSIPEELDIQNRLQTIWTFQTFFKNFTVTGKVEGRMIRSSLVSQAFLTNVGTFNELKSLSLYGSYGHDVNN